MSSFKLRPHHGLCIQFFEGKGYSPEFIQHMTSVISHLQKLNPCLMLTVGTDNICSHCPHCEGNFCDSADKVRRFDTAVLEYCNLAEGTNCHWEELQALIKEKSSVRGLLGEICGDCQWFGICGTKELS